MKTILQVFIGLSLCVITCFRGSAQEKIDIKSDVEISLDHSDTLTVNYTYWWPQSGPFIGQCGERYAFVFLGTIISVEEEDEKLHYISKKGVVKIDSVLVANAIKKDRYEKQHFFVSDCFEHIEVTAGDQVIVFCYEYEGNYSIPGVKSVLKITNDEDPILEPIKRYIASKQNALVLQKDIALWEKYDLVSHVKQIISCKEILEKQ